MYAAGAMQTLDLAILVAYLLGIVLLGAILARRQRTTADYFLGSRRLPWWAIAMSIVATETSTITFISVPGIVYAKGGNFQFIQLALGYLIGRIVIALTLIPLYFRGELLTVYQLLGERFGLRVRVLASGLFVTMRNIADGIRLLLTAIVLAAVYTALNAGAPADTTVIVGAIVLLGVVMIAFTVLGGIEAVIWVEVIQLVIYVGGAIAAAVVITEAIPGGWAQAVAAAERFGKFAWLDWGLRETAYSFPVPFVSTSLAFSLPVDVSKSYTFLAGVIGGCFLTLSTHGTDQYLVQRYLCTDRPGRAGAALVVSGAVVLAQFLGFLLIGALLFAFYAPFNDPAYAAATGAFPFAGGDRVFPDFITRHLPVGLAGLVVAAIFAAALSSSLNAIASTVVNDFYRPWRPQADERTLMRLSRRLTIAFGVVQVGVAIAVMHEQRPALDAALSIAALINGPILGVFLVGSLLPRARERDALAGMAASLVVMAYLVYLEFGRRLGWLPEATPIGWPWYVLIGSTTTLLVAAIASRLPRPPQYAHTTTPP